MHQAVKPVGMTEKILLKSSGILLFVFLWEFLPRAGILDSQFLPTFTAALYEMWKMFTSGVMFTSVMVSLWRALIGLIIAAAAAIPLGLWIGFENGKTERRLRPMLRLLSQVNPFSLMPIFILFFGIGEVVKLAVVGWVCLWPLLFNTIEGAKSADPILVKTAKAMGAGRFIVATGVILPEASAFIFAGLRVGVEMSFFMLIAAEMVGATAGIGWLLHNSAMNVQIGRIYAASLATVLLGFGLSHLLQFLQKHLFFWRKNSFDSSAGRSAAKETALKKWQAYAVSVLVVLLLTVGTWQVEVSRQNQSQFNHIPHDHSVPHGSQGME